MSGAANVITDPMWRTRILGVLRRHIPPACAPEELPPMDVAVISHTHEDHYDPDGLARIPGPPTVVVPWRCGAALRKRGFDVIEMRPWDVRAIGAVTVTAVPARHTFAPCLGYVIEQHGKKVYFPGDTKLFDGIERLAAMAIDVMLVGYGGAAVVGSTWTSAQAATAVGLIRPSCFVPIHWGTFHRWWTWKEPEGPEAFGVATERRTGVPARVLRVGESMRVG